jgi:hypothetical protein
MALQNGIVLGDFVPSCQHQIPQQIQSNSQTKPDNINIATNLNVAWRVYHYSETTCIKKKVRTRVLFYVLAVTHANICNDSCC